MSTNDYLKFITEQVIKFMDTPKEERKIQRKKRKSENPSFLNVWFGIIPFSIALSIKKRKKRTQ
ncbi:YqzE family protein [Aeribacillus alveayuensis]|uniref:YqzE family protein n=1 Tax=Aeribacillus alveayuensis TaxID=279215 RepID=A0ABT9VK69_9BACI|nr:hypothetical protein [Bacillus alveayuensis]